MPLIKEAQRGYIIFTMQKRPIFEDSKLLTQIYIQELLCRSLWRMPRSQKEI